MKTARLFRDGSSILVNAEEVKAGHYDRNEEFVDPEYEFRVRFVKAAKNNGDPYFRLYYSYEDYKRLFPERASKYEIVANMRRFQESKWHKHWKNSLSSFCQIEQCIKNSATGKWKFADAYYSANKTCIEFQHSYISSDFEERNKFYLSISISTIWLYDLSNANVRKTDEDTFEILENNAKGFFKISENPKNLSDNLVYIQVKSGKIFRIKNLLRRISSSDKQSTIRYFKSNEIYTDKDFIERIKDGSILSDTYNIKKNKELRFITPINNKDTQTKIPKPLNELWHNSYKWIIVKNCNTDEKIFINCDNNGGMYRDFKTNYIRYKYVDNKYGENEYPLYKRKEYSLSTEKELLPIWTLVRKEKLY